MALCRSRLHDGKEGAHMRNFRSRRLAIWIVTSGGMVLSIFPPPLAARAELPANIALTLTGPTQTFRLSPTTYSGSLTLEGLPMAGQTIQVLVDGVVSAEARTGIDGVYSAQVAFGDLEPHSVRSAWRSLPLAERSSNSLTVQAIPAAATAIAEGAYHTCALIGDGTARCWGSNGQGQLGDGVFTSTYHSNTPVVVSGLSGATAIATGGYHSCALIGDGTARCWGYNSHSQLGDGTFFNRATPVVVSGLSGATAIAAGGQHTCALIEGGTARCWGNNDSGQLGDGTTTNRTTPVVVSGLSGATAIAAGFDHTCAVIGDGTARCWGSNNYGQLGNSPATPTQVKL